MVEIACEKNSVAKVIRIVARPRVIAAAVPYPGTRRSPTPRTRNSNNTDGITAAIRVSSQTTGVAASIRCSTRTARLRS